MDTEPTVASSPTDRLDGVAAPGSLSLAAVEVINQRKDGLGISGKRLAELIQMPQTSLARILRGEGDMTLDDFAKISVALGTNMLGLAHEAIEHWKRSS